MWVYLPKSLKCVKLPRRLVNLNCLIVVILTLNKLCNYKFDDNIFRKVMLVPKGKSHGLILLLDCSGSMSDNMAGSIEQILVLSMFCRKVNIPFEVYAFSTAWKEKSSEFIPMSPKKAGHIVVDNKFALLNLFSSRMTNNEFRKMATDLLNFLLNFDGFKDLSILN